MPPVLGREVVKASKASRSFVKQATAWGYLASYLAAKVFIALSASARPSAIQISCRAALAAVCRDFGSLFKTLAVLWTAALAAGVGKDLLQRLPEAQSAIADGELGTNREPAPAQACQQLTRSGRSRAPPPGSPRVPCVPPAWRRQNASRPTLEIDAIGPHVDVASGRQVAPAPALVLGLPLRLQAADHLRRQARGVLAEQRLQRLLEVPAGYATKVERRQNRIQRPRPPRETGRMADVKRMRSPPTLPRSRTFGRRTEQRQSGSPVPARGHDAPGAGGRCSCAASTAATSASMACARSSRAPARSTSVSGSAVTPGWCSATTLSSVMAYHSLLGDREASSPPTIRHLLLSARHPLSAIAQTECSRDRSVSP